MIIYNEFYPTKKLTTDPFTYNQIIYKFINNKEHACCNISSHTQNTDKVKIIGVVVTNMKSLAKVWRLLNWNLAAHRYHCHMGKWARKEAAVPTEKSTDQFEENTKPEAHWPDGIYKDVIQIFGHQHSLVTVSSCSVVFVAASAMIAE